jgi:hypothetical protein
MDDPMSAIHHAFSKISYEAPETQKQYALDLGYERDDNLSGKNYSVFHNKDTKNTVLAFRGTQDVADLPVDGLTLLNLGSHSGRYKNAHKVAKKVIAKYGTEGTSLTGHSLGGAVALDINRKTGLTTTAFNPLSSINGLGTGLTEKVYCKTVGKGSTRCKNAQNSTVIKTLGDPVASRYQGADRIKTVAPKKANIHSLDNF